MNDNEPDPGAAEEPPVGEVEPRQLTLGVAFDSLNQVVRLAFGEPVAWVALTPPQAIELGTQLMKAAGATHIQYSVDGKAPA